MANRLLRTQKDEERRKEKETEGTDRHKSCAYTKAAGGSRYTPRRPADLGTKDLLFDEFDDLTLYTL